MKGEDEACLYLISQGYSIVERNWRSSHLELDIISLLGNELHVVEVKSREVPAMAEPESNVTRDKRNRMVLATNAYINDPEKRKTLPANLEIFFDVLTVLFDGPNFEIEYYPQAFIPIYA